MARKPEMDFGFMQSRAARIVLNGLVSVITAFYAASAVGELIRPSAQYVALIEQIGQMGFYVLIGAQLIVCVWVSIAFARLTLKELRSDKK